MTFQLALFDIYITNNFIYTYILTQTKLDMQHSVPYSFSQKTTNK